MKKFFGRIFGAIKPFLKKVNDDNIFAIAGQSAYFMVLALVPLSMFAVSILQNLHIPVNAIDKALGFVLSKQAVTYVSNFLGNASMNSVGVSFITLIITLWSAAQGLHAITNGLNRIHNTYENGNWFFLRLRAMFYTVVFFVILLASALIIVLGASINSALTPHLTYLPRIVGLLYNLRYLIIFLYLSIFFAFIYRNIPNVSRSERKKHGFTYQLPGAMLSAAAWILLSLGISIYVGDFNGFSIYGSLAKLAVMMIWLYFCIVFLMLGAEINSFYFEQIKNFTDNKILRKNKKKDKKGK